MPDIQVTDELGVPVEHVEIDLSHPSSLIKYLRTELLHLAVLPDFLERKDRALAEAAPNPIRFDAKVGHKFELGNTKPAISVTPAARSTIRVNASLDSNLFESDPFRLKAKVPLDTGYVAVGFEGSLDLGVSGCSGDFTFGFAADRAVAIEYLKAFPLQAGGPTLGQALRQTLSGYVIPADTKDLESLGINDIATVSSRGSLKVSGGLSISAVPNPLASVNLPLAAGTANVKIGCIAGLSASATLSGTYQIRVHRTGPEVIELSFVQERGTTLKTDLSASAGVAANVLGTDLIAAALGAISTDPAGDRNLLGDLQPKELKTLAGAIKDGLNHSLEASLDRALSEVRNDQAAFQYEIRPRLLSPEASRAVHHALDGDLSLLTAMEEAMTSGGLLAPGLRMLNSVFAQTREKGLTLRINLLGLLNYVSVSDLIRNSEIVTDPVSGDVTIKESVTGTSISAIVDPLRRHEELRKAIYDAVLATTSYRAGKAVSIPELSCAQVHFILNQNTSQQVMGKYLTWFAALKLLTDDEREKIPDGFVEGSASTCLLRTAFNDSACSLMFFDDQGCPRPVEHYVELGRRALRALLASGQIGVDRLRYQIVDDGLWARARAIGANVNLGPLVGLSTSDPRVEYLIGDVYVITQWSTGMAEAGKLLQEMRAFVGTAAPSTLLHNNEFKRRRDKLQKKLAAVIGASKTRFDEPWGMVALFWAAGSPATAYGKAVTGKLTVERGAPSVPQSVPAGAINPAGGAEQ